MKVYLWQNNIINNNYCNLGMANSDLYSQCFKIHVDIHYMGRGHLNPCTTGLGLNFMVNI